MTTPVGLHWVHFDYDPEIGRNVWIGYDDHGNPRAARIEQEIDAILDANAEAEKLTQGVRFGDYRALAGVPLTLMEKSGLGDAIDARDKRFISRFMNNSDHSKLRTSRGRV